MWLPTWKRQGIIRPDCRDWPGRGSKRWRVSRPGWRHSGLDSDTWTGGYSINVDFSEKGFYFSIPPDRPCHTIFLPSNYPGSATCRWRCNRPAHMLKSRRESLADEQERKCNACTFDFSIRKKAFRKSVRIYSAYSSCALPGWLCPAGP